MVNGKREFFRFAANTEYQIIPDDEWEHGEWPAHRRHAIIKESAYREIMGEPVSEPSVVEEEEAEETKTSFGSFLFERSEDEDTQTE